MRESAFAASFDESGFVTAIKSTMQMGIPQDPAERLVFHWAAPSTATPASPAGSPYEWDQTDVDEPAPGVPAQSVQVDYALEMSQDASSNTMAGTFENPKATVTMLDAEFQQVADADYCTIGTSIYRILYHQPVIGLFGVSVHQLVIQAQDEA